MMLYIGLGAVAFVLLLALIITVIAIKYRVVVPTNMVHIVNSSSGRRVYGKDSVSGNTYYAFPDWLPKIGVNVTRFPTSNFGVELKGYDAYDEKRLPFQVDVQAFFSMEDADVVSQRVANFEELKSYLQKIVSGAVRKVTASLPLEQILAARSELASKFAEEVVEQLKDWGVKPVNSIEFMNIQDSPNSKVIHDIQKKEESRIDRDSRVTQAENAQIAQAKEIESQRKIAIDKEQAEQQIGLRKAEKAQAVGIAQEQASQAVKEQSKITTEKEMEVERVSQTRRAEIERDVALTTADQRSQEMAIAAEAKKKSDVINAQAEQQTRIIAAETQKKSAELAAEAKKKAQELDAEADKNTVIMKAEADKAKAERDAEAEKVRIELIAEAEQKALNLSSTAKLEADKRLAEGTLATTEAEAKGISAVGLAKAEAEKEMQMASVAAQTELATQIGENDGYQNYLLQIRTIEVQGDVGIAQAKALESAEIKIVGGQGANSGLSLGGLLTGLVATDAGKAIVERVAGKALSE